jgi:hypothetical protein
MTKRLPVGIIRTPEGKEYPVKFFSDSQVKREFRPYSNELGYMVVAWNQLHHNLSTLFNFLVKSEDEFVANALWFSTDNDFTQRKMLRAVIELDTQVLPQHRKPLDPVPRREILWILDQIDNKLRHKRNNAIHAPLMLVRGVYDDAVRSWVEAFLSPQNPRASALRGKDLIEEFRDCTELAQVLARYASRIWHVLTTVPQQPWPDRPPLPEAHKKKKKIRRGRRRLPPHLRGA